MCLSLYSSHFCHLLLLYFLSRLLTIVFFNSSKCRLQLSTGLPSGTSNFELLVLISFHSLVCLHYFSFFLFGQTRLVNYQILSIHKLSSYFNIGQRLPCCLVSLWLEPLIQFFVLIFLHTQDRCFLSISVCRLNEIACHHLDHLEESYPIICAPTEQVVIRVKYVLCI